MKDFMSRVNAELLCEQRDALFQAMDDAAQARSRLAVTKGTGKKQKGMQSDLKMFFRK